MRKLIIFALVISSFSLVFAKGNVEKQSTESFGVVSLAPNITEIIYALNQENSLVGRTDTCNYPEECKAVTSVGSPWKPNIEQIITLQPRLVLASSLTDNNSLIALQKAGINTVRINYEQTLNGAYETVKEIGTLLNCQDKASEVIKIMEKRINNVKSVTDSITPSERKKGIYLMTWDDGPLYAATGKTFIDEILNVAGINNIAHNSSLWTINREMLVSNPPDYIFIPFYEDNVPDIEKIRKSLSFLQKKTTVILINGDETERQGPRNADIAEYIAQTVYGATE